MSCLIEFMVKKEVIDDIIELFTRFDKYKKDYVDTFSSDYLSECTKILLKIDALISKAEFDEIESLRRAEESFLSHFFSEIDYKLVMELLESLLNEAKRMQKDTEMESAIVEQLRKRMPAGKLTVNLELRQTMEKLYSSADIGVPNLDNLTDRKSVV